MTAFYVYIARRLPGVCSLGEIEGVDDEWEVTLGVPRASGWPDDAYLSMQKNARKDIGLADSLAAVGACVLSARAKDTILGVGETQVEFLPVTIINHKGRVASQDYFVANPVRIVDCIDINASNVDWNSIDPSLVSTVDRLVLRPDAVPPDAHMFRLRYWPQEIVVRGSLAAEIEARGLTGFLFEDPAEFQG